MRKVMVIAGMAALGLTPLVATAAPVGAQEYPLGTCSLSLSVSTATPGQTVLASTVNCTSPYLGTVAVDLELNSAPIFLATVQTGSDGLFLDTPFVVPQQAELGQHTVRSIGPGADVDTLVLSAPLTIVAAGGQQGISGGGGGSTAGAGGGGGLAFTGSDSILLVWLALILLTIGTVLVLAARRRAEVRRRVAS